MKNIDIKLSGTRQELWEHRGSQIHFSPRPKPNNKREAVPSGGENQDRLWLAPPPKAPGLCVLLLSGPALCVSESQGWEEGHRPVLSNSHLPPLLYLHEVRF